MLSALFKRLYLLTQICLMCPDDEPVGDALPPWRRPDFSLHVPSLLSGGRLLTILTMAHEGKMWLSLDRHIHL